MGFKWQCQVLWSCFCGRVLHKYVNILAYTDIWRVLFQNISTNFGFTVETQVFFKWHLKFRKGALEELFNWTFLVLIYTSVIHLFLVCSNKPYFQGWRWYIMTTFWVGADISQLSSALTQICLDDLLCWCKYIPTACWVGTDISKPSLC